ncbi:MAG TPA: hypothetical protein RMF84_06050 [Polyangiaceae bacterium LLY-WYZ-14_1]|nr:hypothetical protein [Polyangiaceae bacterium LLY-WYZ-14_1]
MPSDGSFDPTVTALTDQAVARLETLPGRRAIPLRADHAERVVDRNGVETVVRSTLHQAPGVDWLRVTRIDNPRGTRILNVAAYPAPERRVPVLHVETVVLRGRLFIAVLEEAPLLDADRAVWPGAQLEPPAALLDRLRGEHADALPDVGERPAWSQGILDPATLWSRPNTEAAIEPGLACLVAVVDHWVRAATLLADAERAGPEEIALARARRGEICRACIEGGPSRPFLRTFFSEAWADGYIEGFLFPYFSDAPAAAAAEAPGEPAPPRQATAGPRG